MSAVVGIATLVLLGVSIIAALAWSCRHRHIVVSGTGRGMAVATAMSCGFIAFALIADNVGVRPARLRQPSSPRSRSHRS